MTTAEKKAILKNALQNEKYRPLVAEAEFLFDKYCKGDIKALKYSEFKIFYQNGSRAEYEKSYFERRGRLTASALCCMLGTAEDALCALEDIIFAICDEYTWALPAHIDFENAADYIDLFAAETGFALSEIYILLEDTLSEPIKNRIKTEIEKRIIKPFLELKFSWETAENNWAAVCAGSVGCAFLNLYPEKFPLIEKRINSAMEYFLKSYMDDGVCREGLGYWGYGFGYFVCSAEAIRSFSNGEIDLFKNEKIKKIAEFQQKVFLSGNTVASFSDGHERGHFHIGLTCFLKKEYGICVPRFEYRHDYTKGTGDNCFRFAHFLRNFLWFDESLISEENEESRYYFDKSDWYIYKNPKYAFAAKAGHNDEPHNHNDVGAFIIAADNEQLICDVGAGEYTKDYFNPKKRYGFLVNSSRGHSVPIINGAEQAAGKESAGKIIRAEENELDIELAEAYKIKELSGLKRNFVFNDSSISLKDTFLGENLNITERFVTKIKPEIKDGRLVIQNMTINFDTSVFNLTIKEEPYRNHLPEDDKLYLIDFACKNPISSSVKAEFDFVFSLLNTGS